MARGLNKVMLIGHLGSDPELRVIPSGQSVANFTLATNESYKDSSGNLQERTEWHRIVAWGRLAEICQQYLKKGRQVYIEGKLQTRSWDDTKTGDKRYATEIVCSDMQMLGSAREGGASQGEATTPSMTRAAADTTPPRHSPNRAVIRVLPLQAPRHRNPTRTICHSNR